MAGARPRGKGAVPPVPEGPRVVVAAGGTAGHVVPAMAVAAALRESAAEVSFLGTRDKMEAELVPASGYEIDFLRVRGIDRRNPLRAARAGLEGIGAVGAARRAGRWGGAPRERARSTAPRSRRSPSARAAPSASFICRGRATTRRSASDWTPLH